MKYSDQELLNILSVFCKKTGRTPGKREIKQSQAMMKRFGSWNAAIEKAGLTPTRKLWTVYQIKQAIIQFEKVHGRVPLSKELDQPENGLPTNDTIKKLTGLTYSKYLKTLGFKPHIKIPDKKYLGMTDTELLQELRFELDRIGTNKFRVFSKERSVGFPDEQYLRKRFSMTWNQLIDKIGLTANSKKYTKEELIDLFFTVYREQIGFTPSFKKLIEAYPFVEYLIKKYYGNYTNMCKSLNIPLFQKSPDVIAQSDEELIKMYVSFSESIGHPATVRELDAADEIYNADVFIIRFGGMNELKRLAGYKHGFRKKKYSKEWIAKELIRLQRKYGRRLTNKEMNQHLSVTTILRYFKTTSMQKVWNKIEKMKVI